MGRPRLWDRVGGFLRLGVLELRRSTGGRAIYLGAGCLVWFVIVALWNALAADEPMQPTSVLNVILSPPVVLLALFLGSQVVASDQENRSLEVVLALPRGRRTVWLVRLLVAVSFTGAIGALLAALSWIFVAGFPLPGVWAASLFPALFFASLAFALSVWMRSGTAAALVASLLLLGIFLTQGAWQRGSLFYIYPFLNPYLRPDPTLPVEWARMVAGNRIGVASASLLLATAGLHSMRKRERLI